MRIGKSGEIFSKYTRGVSPEFRRGSVPGAGTIKLSFMDRKITENEQKKLWVQPGDNCLVSQLNGGPVSMSL